MRQHARNFKKSPNRPLTIRVIYKSGYDFEFDCKSFTYSYDSCSWEDAFPRPITVGLKDVSAIYIVRDDSQKGEE